MFYRSTVSCAARSLMPRAAQSVRVVMLAGGSARRMLFIRIPGFSVVQTICVTLFVAAVISISYRRATIFSYAQRVNSCEVITSRTGLESHFSSHCAFRCVPQHSRRNQLRSDKRSHKSRRMRSGSIQVCGDLNTCNNQIKTTKTKRNLHRTARFQRQRQALRKVLRLHLATVIN